MPTTHTPGPTGRTDPRRVASAATGPARKRGTARRGEPPGASDAGPATDAALRRRVVIEDVTPEVDGGRFPARRILGERLVVEATIFADGQEPIAADLLYRRSGERAWNRVEMEQYGEDRFRGQFVCDELPSYEFTIEAWIHTFAKWQHDLSRRKPSGQDFEVALEMGAHLLADGAGRAPSEGDRRTLLRAANQIVGSAPRRQRLRAALDPDLTLRMRSLSNPRLRTAWHRALRVKVDPPKAGFSSWYEMFPRSASPDPDRPGTLRDVERRLPYVAEMGFDVLYLPPIHPIGTTHRKGPNNADVARPGDPGSPWAIGSPLGGHKAIDPALGTFADFRNLLRAARRLGIEIALDVAFQCSPDHPYVTRHPEWFRKRPDGTIQYAENPPKKYQDIYPFDYETEARESLWQELLSIFLFWMDRGVRIFRVDNPHTKPFPFWEWCIAEIHRVDPGVILLAEAFTRQTIMYRLTKLGFTQSYSYFPWRYDKIGITRYFTELTHPPVSDFFHPNAWPNTPDILTGPMQYGSRAVFITRLVLAATLSASYGIYGPPFELMENVPREKGSEEYLDSEKYVVKHWDIDRPDSLRSIVARVNAIRRENPALQSDARLRFHRIANGRLIAYSKATEDNQNIILCVVNLDPAATRAGHLTLPIADWGIPASEPYEVSELLSGAACTWQGNSAFVELDPGTAPAQIFRLHRQAALDQREGR